MKIAITGASGFIGKRLVEALSDHQPIALKRSGAEWETPEELDAVVHLAGEPVAQWWTATAKARIRGSRVMGTRNLIERLARLRHPPSVLVCASGVGYYGSRADEILTENHPAGSGFLARTC